MKKFVLLGACLFITLKLLAQDCTQYYYMQKNKIIEMSSYDEKGQFIGKGTQKVSDVTTTNGITTAILIVESFDKNGKSRGKTSISYKCSGGGISMDMNFNNKPKYGETSKTTTDINVSSMEYPAGMKVGDHLKDVTVVVNEGTVVATAKVTDRTVVSKENVTTTAGSWTCLKITYKTTTTVKGYNMAPQVVETTEWYVPNFGIVKTQLYGTVSEITGLK